MERKAEQYSRQLFRDRLSLLRFVREWIHMSLPLITSPSL